MLIKATLLLLLLSAYSTVQAGQPYPEQAHKQMAKQATVPAYQAQFFRNRSDGMSAISNEIDALKQLIQIVQSLPAERGRFTINFRRLLTDLDRVQSGVLETINRPTTAPVLGQGQIPALYADYSN